MQCQQQLLKGEKEQEERCTSNAVGMYKTRKGNVPLCEHHRLWAKGQNFILRNRDNYFG